MKILFVLFSLLGSLVSASALADTICEYTVTPYSGGVTVRVIDSEYAIENGLTNGKYVALHLPTELLPLQEGMKSDLPVTADVDWAKVSYSRGVLSFKARTPMGDIQRLKLKVSPDLATATSAKFKRTGSGLYSIYHLGVNFNCKTQ
jgi:hypothetical protein